MPPYGYRKDSGDFVPDEPGASAIADAFHLIVELGPKWSSVAKALNEQGYCRKDGKDWTGDDVRTLIRIPTYAGYIAKNGEPIYRADFIPHPIVDVRTFLEAARHGQGRKGMGWLRDLERMV